MPGKITLMMGFDRATKNKQLFRESAAYAGDPADGQKIDQTIQSMYVDRDMLKEHLGDVDKVTSIKVTIEAL